MPAPGDQSKPYRQWKPTYTNPVKNRNPIGTEDNIRNICASFSAHQLREWIPHVRRVNKEARGFGITDSEVTGM